MNIADKPNIESLIMAVDQKSRQIITHLLRERHAEIRELAQLCHASSDMEVLFRIRKVINPKSEMILGKPILEFEHSKIDPLTGERIAFSWWLREELTDSYNHELLDVFNEDKILRVVTILPPQEKTVRVKLRKNCLILSGKRYRREVPLFHSVGKKVRQRLNNGVLEVRLSKVE